MKKQYLKPVVDVISLKVESIICQSVDALAPLTEFETLADPIDLIW